MKRNTMMLALAAAILCAVGAHAQGQDQAAQAAPAAADAPATAGKMTPAQKKSEWQAGVKADCSAEIAPGGVCAGMDFGTGLEKCLHQNRKKLTPGCRVTVRPRHKKAAAAADGATMNAPAAAPAAAPSAAPQQ